MTGKKKHTGGTAGCCDDSCGWVGGGGADCDDLDLKVPFPAVLMGSGNINGLGIEGTLRVIGFSTGAGRGSEDVMGGIGVRMSISKTFLSVFLDLLLCLYEKTNEN